MAQLRHQSQTATIKITAGRRLHSGRLRIESVAAVLDTQGQTTTLPDRFDLQAHADEACLQRTQTFGALLVIKRKARRIMLDAAESNPNTPCSRALLYSSPNTMCNAAP